MKSLMTTVIGFALAALLAPQGVSAQSGLTVPESSVSTMVVDRMPSGVAMTFPADVGRISAWTRIQGADVNTMIHHVWIHGGVERADVELRIGGSPWRTWSDKAIVQNGPATGAWKYATPAVTFSRRSGLRSDGRRPVLRQACGPGGGECRLQSRQSSSPSSRPISTMDRKVWVTQMVSFAVGGWHAYAWSK